MRDRESFPAPSFGPRTRNSRLGAGTATLAWRLLPELHAEALMRGRFRASDPQAVELSTPGLATVTVLERPPPLVRAAVLTRKCSSTDRLLARALGLGCPVAALAGASG